MLNNNLALKENQSLSEEEIRDRVITMRALAIATKIDGEESYCKITSLYSEARDWKKQVESKRKALTEPLRKQIASVNDRARELTDPLDEIIQITNRKAGDYAALLESKRIEQEISLKEAASLFDSEREVFVEEIPSTIRGDGALSVTKIEKRFRLIDITKVPSKYLTIDEAAVKQDLKLGVQEIPGLEVYEEKTTNLRVR